MKKIILGITILTFLYSCTSDREIQKTVYPDLFDGKYDSEFPYRSASDQLENISKTIRLVNSIAFYRTYHFKYSDRMTISAIRRGEHEKYLAGTTTFEETASGTGTIVYNTGNTIGVLTCAHIINFPDSVAGFYTDSEGNKTGLIRNISIIKKRDVYVVPFEGEGDFTVAAEDVKSDLALLKTTVQNPQQLKIKTFDFPLGKATELEWGTFVYIFGFPVNYKMISKAIVSSPNLDNNGSFLIDAIFNQGFSGGIVIAIRDGVPNFELVGMVKSVPAEYEYVLRPKKDNEITVGKEYEGKPIVDSRANIKYGVTRILSIEAILDFFNDNKNEIEKNGFSMNNFFN